MRLVGTGRGQPAAGGEELRQIEERCRLALESAGVGTWDYYPQREILNWCNRCRELGELDPRQDVDYETFLSTIHPDDRQRVEKAAQTALSSGPGGDYRLEYRLRGVRTGKEVWLSVLGRVYFDSTGQPVRFIGTAQDVTEQKRAELGLERRVEQLQESNRELEEFSSVVSHDLGEQLRMVAAFLGLLSQNYRRKLAPEADEFIDFAVAGSKRMRKLIEALTQLTEVGSSSLSLRFTDAALILDAVLRQLGPEIRKRSARIDFSSLPVIWCDPELVGLVFQNLIVNVLQLSQSLEAPRVEIASWPKGDSWEFSIREHSAGLETPIKKKLLEFAVPGAAGELGPGVGLAITKKIIEKHGGKIWAERCDHGGSAFHFVLPKQPATLLT